jgi:hypothetical protein
MGTHLAFSAFVLGSARATGGLEQMADHLRSDFLPQHLESSLAVTAETIDCEVVVEARGLRDAQTLHDGEAGPIDDREALIREGFPDGPSGFEVGGADGLDPYRPASDSVPEAFGSLTMIAAVQEQPSFHDNVVGRNVLRGSFQNRLRSGVVPIPRYHGGKPYGGIYENAQRELARAWSLRRGLRPILRR